MVRRVVAVLAAAALVVGLGIVVWPQGLGLTRIPPVAQAISFRAPVALGLLGTGIVIALIALAARRVRRPLALLAVVLLAFSALEGGILASRGWGGAARTTADDVTVLSWNTRGDAPGAETIARLALDEKADIVSLPETSAATAEAVAVRMRQGGRPMYVHNRYFDTVLKARTTSLLISPSLGRYRLATASSTPVIPSGVFEPVDGSGPTIVAAHPVAPVRGQMANWRAGLSWLAERCDRGDEIVAGDFNSTLDHWAGLGRDGGDLGTCRDGAKSVGAASLGTWPTDVPIGLGTPIDHVLAGRDWTFTSFRVVGGLDGAGSDHRPIVARLHRAAG